MFKLTTGGVSAPLSAPPTLDLLQWSLAVPLIDPLRCPALPFQVTERGATITKSNLSAVCTSAATRFTTRYSCVYIVYMCLYSAYVLTYSVSAATVMSTKRERERGEGSQHSRWVGSVPIINVHLMVSKLECNHNKQWQQKQRDKKQTRRATQQKQTVETNAPPSALFLHSTHNPQST